VQEACKKLWLISKSDLQLTELVLTETKKYLQIPDIESYDPLNLLLVNVARALLIDPQDAIVQLTWVRLQHIMAMSSGSWKIDETLKNSTAEKLAGCAKFVF